LLLNGKELDGRQRNMEAVEILVELVRERDWTQYWEEHRNAVRPSEMVSIFFAPTDGGPTGTYSPKLPLITIYRRGCREGDPTPSAELARVSPAPVEELVVLAHELGHHQSAMIGRFPDLDRASDDERLEEEILAWDHARTILAAKGFSDWPAFDARKCLSLQDYRLNLKLSSCPDRGT
jgi:hypothetical protein